MADQNKKKHFIIKGFTSTEAFSPPKQKFTTPPIPQRERSAHGSALLSQLESIKPVMTDARSELESLGFEDGFGLRIEFKSFPGIELAFESLARERSGIELMNVRLDENDVTYATIFVPDGKLEHFERLVQDYLNEKKNKAGGAQDHKKLINTIANIRLATLRALWTDDLAVLPENEQEEFWWEVWLPIRKDRQATISKFRYLAEIQGITVADGELHFPERTVLQARTSASRMAQSMMTLNSIAELRRAKETAGFFDELTPITQQDWVEELLDRSEYAPLEQNLPYVTILDTGVNNGHPLISPALIDKDCHSVEPSWGLDDANGHGTEMAGLALFGNLTDAMSMMDSLAIRHRLESVKLLQDDGANGGDAKHHGYLTSEAVARAEITDPFRRRVFSMAITAKDNRDRGRPSAWSATLDRLSADVEEDGDSPRLVVVSAGNINDPDVWAEYPERNSTDGIHDPAQSWNALTVGAYTQLVNITEANTEDYRPIAAEGGLSPFSTTSQTWQAFWPFKPDIVFEGGNAARDSYGPVSMQSLSLLTTYHLPTTRLLTTTNATSAATALAARMAAQIMSEYPLLWPETVRGLMVHSATWTENMKQMFLPSTGSPTKSDYVRIIRHCGFGVPQLQRALWSLSNSLTMVIETDLHPFVSVKGSQPKLRDMNLHQLPWPLAALESLGQTQVEMRVTLSYFIEPNPSARGIRSRYRYESHGLRFEVKRPYESDDDFRARVNAAARDEEEGSRLGGNDSGWIVGKKNRHKGSLHSDIWQGIAADLASRGTIAVYPALGWWKTRTSLARYNKKARYSLVVSIHVPEVTTDLYTAVADQIAVPINIE